MCLLMLSSVFYSVASFYLPTDLHKYRSVFIFFNSLLRILSVLCMNKTPSQDHACVEELLIEFRQR